MLMSESTVQGKNISLLICWDLKWASLPALRDEQGILMTKILLLLPPQKLLGFEGGLLSNWAWHYQANQLLLLFN